MTTKSLRARYQRKLSRALRSQLRFEQLEDRRVMALLGVVPNTPLIAYNSTGVVNYDPVTQHFKANATPLVFLDSSFALVQPPSSFDIDIRVSNSGALLGGVPGDDFVLVGSIDLDGDSIIDVSGPLLTGEVTGFGFFNNPEDDLYDFRFKITGGALT